MAKSKPSKKKKKQNLTFSKIKRAVFMSAGVFVFVSLFIVVLYKFCNPHPGLYMGSEARRLGGINQEWTKIEDFSPYMARSVVAAEDANFCLHHGVDIDALRDAIAGGGSRGASTITQQVAKNIFLWHGRSYIRKGLEAWFAVLIDAIWSKQRILEVYLNVAEFDAAVFGAASGGRHYFGVSPSEISKLQAARLAAILPSPKKRSASKPSSHVKRKTRRVISGAETILADGRANCFEDG